jgi:flavodoxin
MKVLLVFSSQTGNTRKLAQAVYDGLTKNVLDTAVDEAVI